jgi:uncharacterized phage protein gp47/JayE
MRYIDWLALQFLPDTAETEWLDRHGAIWLTNADGTFGRKSASLAQGSATVTGVPGTVVPAATQLNSGDFNYETLSQIEIGTIETPIDIRALNPGLLGNLENGSPLGFVNPLPNVDDIAFVVELTGGTDDETDEELRARILQRIRETPMGGDAKDYEQWALAVPGVTRAWCYPLEMGIGTVTIRFVMDDVRADNHGIPNEDDVLAVEQYITAVRPVAVKDIFVEAPIPQPMSLTITDLVPDTPDVRNEIQDSLTRLLLTAAAPGQTIYSVWKSYAIMGTDKVISFRLIDDVNEVMQSPGHMAILDTIIFDVPDAVVPQGAIPFLS